MAIPSSKGWETADWQAWFELLLGKAIGRLRDLKKGKGDPAKHVHESRKMLKRLRTGTRLLRGFARKKDLRKAKITIRDAARFLSGSRDGTVRLDTFESLIEMSGKKVKGTLLEARTLLEQEAVAASRTAGEGSVDALELLETASIPEDSWRSRGKDDVKNNLARILGRARNYFDAMHEDQEEEFHELRKLVKDLYYALGALPGHASGARKRVLMAIHVFEESLGKLNDLAVLMEWFEDRGFGRDVCPEFWKMAKPAAKGVRRIILEEGVILDELGEDDRYRKVFIPKGEELITG